MDSLVCSLISSALMFTSLNEKGHAGITFHPNSVLKHSQDYARSEGDVTLITSKTKTEERGRKRLFQPHLCFPLLRPRWLLETWVNWWVCLALGMAFIEALSPLLVRGEGAGAGHRG